MYILAKGPDEEPRDKAIILHSFPKATDCFWYTREVTNTIHVLSLIKYTCKNECFMFFNQISDHTNMYN